MKSSEGYLSTVFVSQSVVLKVNSDGGFSNPSGNDPLMTKEFNMFDALKRQIEFNRAHGFSTDSLEAAEGFEGTSSRTNFTQNQHMRITFNFRAQSPKSEAKSSA